MCSLLIMQNSDKIFRLIYIAILSRSQSLRLAENKIAKGLWRARENRDDFVTILRGFLTHIQFFRKPFPSVCDTCEDIANSRKRFKTGMRLIVFANCRISVRHWLLAKSSKVVFQDKEKQLEIRCKSSCMHFVGDLDCDMIISVSVFSLQHRP